ncbi:D-2-hydroxyacid dehydrogenase [Gayadomonas joobiniege]|uniref:D-2-hydroxyacid dehydrogenase n=1 Tax=Gayadomonas joobiniege TaxID=1234606 RepID=UPI000381B3BE|nr:D-2-hydroxyacid dehydrogenase [Gayadomonas joobiniege]
MHISFLDADTLGELDYQLINKTATSIDRYSSDEFRQNPAAALENANVVITNKVVIGEAELALAKQLKLVCVAATGYNNVDLQACQKAGVKVCNVKGYSTDSVAQHVFALLLNWASRISDYNRTSFNGEWVRSRNFSLLNYATFELAGKTLGIIGYGDTGQATANIGRAFGMQVLIAERQGENELRAGRTPFWQVVEQADILSLHCPLTEQNMHMVNRAFLERMQADAILVNVARGGLINEHDLCQALQDNLIQAALLDGLSVEPPPREHPLLQKRLDNLSITPHTAWATLEARQRLLNQIANNISDFLAGNYDNMLV